EQFDQRFDMSLGDAGRGRVEFATDPTHDAGRIRELAGLEQADHALLAAGALSCLQVAVDPAGFGHVELPLTASNSPCAHRSNSRNQLSNRWYTANRASRKGPNLPPIRRVLNSAATAL